MIKKIFFVVLIIAACVVFFLLQEKKDLSDKALKIDRAVNEALVDSGITDADIINQYWREKKDSFTKWVEITKEIKLPKNVEFSRLKENLQRAGKSSGAQAAFTQEKGKQPVLVLGTDKKAFVSIVFYSVIRPKIAIVVDDVGYEDKKIQEFLDLGIPVNFSIFPKERYSRELAQLLEKNNIPYLMHQPMEPEGYPKVDPGKAALLGKMNKAQIKKMLLDNLQSVGNPIAVNNHMGSSFTTKRFQMYVLLSELKVKNMFFFDSRTSTETAGKFIANKVGVPCLVNDIFLDVTDDQAYMEKQFRFLIKIARRAPYAIAICHIHKQNMIPAFRAMMPEFEKENIEFVYLKDLLDVKKPDVKKMLQKSQKKVQAKLPVKPPAKLHAKQPVKSQKKGAK